MLDNIFSLEGKVAIVTGGTRGIGEMIATAFVDAGVKTYITSRNAESCEAMESKLSGSGLCRAHPSDLSSVEGIEAFSSWYAGQEDRLDILVNNAGATWGQPLEEFSENGWDRVVGLNLKSPFFLTQKLLSPLRAAAAASGSGRVINIGSIDGLTVPGMPGNYVYPASKAGVHHLTRVLASALAVDQITVNAIAPGPFESKMTAFALSTEEGRKAVGDAMPLGRIGQPEDIGGLSVFLASRAADYITGATIPLDGGYANLR